MTDIAVKCGNFTLCHLVRGSDPASHIHSQFVLHLGPVQQPGPTKKIHEAEGLQET
jgi:hypothetical protein